MNRVLLACITLVLPSFVSAAAPCDVLPYANQCQGSNLWPVPAGWTADNNGDCQPEPPAYVNATPGFTFTHGWASGQAFGTTAEATVADGCAKMHVGYPLMGVVLSSCRISTPNEVLQAAGSLPVSCIIADSGPLAVWHVGPTPTPVSCFRWDTNVQSSSPGFSYTPLSPTWGCIDPGYPTKTSGPRTGCTTIVCCAKAPLAPKPADGRCTARWATSAEATLQKDPLDPDCDAQSCVLDGTCQLR